MKGSTKLWLSVYIILSMVSWYFQFGLLEAYGMHRYAPEGAPLWVLWLGANLMTLFCSLCIPQEYRNIHSMWAVILAPMGVFVGLIFPYLWKGFRILFKGISIFFITISSWADKNLGI